MLTCWISYREFWFDADFADIRDADLNQIHDIAAYIQRNPSLILGIDINRGVSDGDQRNLGLAHRRGDAIRNALVAAGVPDSRIVEGALGDVNLRRTGRVEVLITTADRMTQGK